MKKPSPQFIGKLEDELRVAYRAQFQPQKSSHFFMNFFKFFVPAVSGALVLMILFTAPHTKTPQPNNDPANDQADRFVAFNEGTDEEQIIQNFDNEELNQIDSEVQLVANSNYE